MLVLQVTEWQVTAVPWRLGEEKGFLNSSVRADFFPWPLLPEWGDKPVSSSCSGSNFMWGFHLLLQQERGNGTSLYLLPP